VSGIDSFESPPLLAERVLEPSQADTEVRRAGPISDAVHADVRKLFEAHYASVWRLLRRFGVPPSQLDDAAQEVFWVAARRISDIQPGREHAFLYGVALRVASHVLRRRKSAPPMTELERLPDIVDPGPSPEGELEQQRARQLLDTVLDRLPLELRTVFVLFELEGIPVRDIAELEEIPVGTASSRLRRAREEFSAIAKRVRALVGRGESL
jgi:RNA polymerase sigma-70 factor (ECF subfamily)